MKNEVGEYMQQENMEIKMYKGMKKGEIEEIIKKGKEEKKEKYMKKMVEGKWKGKMKMKEKN